MGIMAGIGGLVGGLGGLFGGSHMPAAPPQFQMPNMPQAANNAFNQIGGLGAFTGTATNMMPFGQQTFSNLYNNPFTSMMMGGANTGANMGMNAAMGGYNTGGILQQAGLGTIPWAQQLFQSGFDPQNALYSRTLQQTQDAARANAEAAGIGATPYGAGLANQATNNFNIDWQNQQLQRQIMGAQGAGGLLSTGGNLANLGTGIQNLAPSQFFQASMMPYGAWGQIGQDQNSAINSMLGIAGAGANLANLPIQDYLSYLGIGNQANQVQNQNYGLQLQAQNQQFNQQMGLGSMLGQSLYGLGRALPNFNVTGMGGGGAFFPSMSFLDHGFGFG